MRHRTLELQIHPTRVEKPQGIELGLELPVIAQQRRGQWLERCVAGTLTIAGGMATDFMGQGLHRVGLGFQPALGAGPVDQLRAGQDERPGMVGQRQAPQRQAFIEEGQLMFIECRPVLIVDQLATETLMSSADRAFATLQAQVQAVAVMAGGADGQGLTAPFGEFFQGLGAVQFQADTQAVTGLGQDLQRKLR